MSRSVSMASARRWRAGRGLGLVVAIAVVIAGRPGQARAQAAEPTAANKPSREQIQQLHESCQRQIDEDRAVEAAQCLERVYAGLVALDASATVDLYYVLADAVAALQAAGEADPRELCRADALLQDYRGRKARIGVRRHDGKVANLHKNVKAALQQARGPTQRDVCAEEAPTSVEAPATPETREPGEAPTEVPASGEPPASAGDEPGAATPTSAAAAPPPPPSRKAAGRRTTPRRQLFQRLPYTAMLDASFGVTLAGVTGTGIGAALYIYGLECKEGPPRCSDPAPVGVRDAGLVMMSAGAATMIVGFGLRFADHRAARKALRALPRPAASPTAMGLSWAGRF